MSRGHDFHQRHGVQISILDLVYYQMIKVYSPSAHQLSSIFYKTLYFLLSSVSPTIKMFSALLPTVDPMSSH